MHSRRLIDSIVIWVSLLVAPPAMATLRPCWDGLGVPSVEYLRRKYESDVVPQSQPEITETKTFYGHRFDLTRSGSPLTSAAAPGEEMTWFCPNDHMAFQIARFIDRHARAGESRTNWVDVTGHFERSGSGAPTFFIEGIEFH